MTLSYAGFTFLIRYTTNFSLRRYGTWTLRITGIASPTVSRQVIYRLATYGEYVDLLEVVKEEIDRYGVPLTFYS